METATFRPRRSVPLLYLALLRGSLLAKPLVSFGGLEIQSYVSREATYTYGEQTYYRRNKAIIDPIKPNYYTTECYWTHRSVVDADVMSRLARPWHFPRLLRPLGVIGSLDCSIDLRMKRDSGSSGLRIAKQGETGCSQGRFETESQGHGPTTHTEPLSSSARSLPQRPQPAASSYKASRHMRLRS